MIRNILIKKLKSKDLYFQSWYAVITPSCIQSWSEMLNMNVNEVWLTGCRENQYYNMYYRKDMNFHWQIIHRAVYSETRLQKMK